MTNVDAITAELSKVDDHYRDVFWRITEAEDLVPAAKRRRLEAAKAEYREAWTLKKREVEERLQEEGERLYRQAHPPEDIPSDPQTAMVAELRRARVRDQAERLRGQDGKILAAYEHAARAGDIESAKAWEEAAPDILTVDEAKRDFDARADKERRLRMSDSEIRARSQLGEFYKEHGTASLGLALQEQTRQRGYAPQERDSTQLVTHQGRGGFSGDAEVSEINRRERFPFDPPPTERPGWIDDGGRYSGSWDAS